jgi:hypothetical protein
MTVKINKKFKTTKIKLKYLEKKTLLKTKNLNTNKIIATSTSSPASQSLKSGAVFYCFS